MRALCFFFEKDGPFKSNRYFSYGEGLTYSYSYQASGAKQQLLNNFKEQLIKIIETQGRRRNEKNFNFTPSLSKIILDCNTHTTSFFFSNRPGE